MYIEKVPNRNSPPAVLLRESYREGDQVKKRTLANLSKLPDDIIDNLKLALKGATLSMNEGIPNHFEVIRSLPHGHVMAILETIKKLGLDKIISEKSSRIRNLVVAMIVARIINPKSKLATARGFNSETCSQSLGQLLDLEKADEDELYNALDWLLEKQDKIEKHLALKHLESGTLVLYDVTSTYLEGNGCELGKYGYNRDKKKGKTQIVFGLLCSAKGCPIAVEVFEGNTSDGATLSGQIEKVRKGWGIENVVWVSDRGILTNSKIKELVKPIEGLDYITGLTKPQIRKLAEVEVIQLGLFDQVNLVEFESEDYPDERLIACRNPLIAQKNQQQREALLEAVEKELDLIVQATQREKRALKGQDKIALRVGKVLNQFKVNKYYNLEITEEGFSYQRKLELIAQETALDGVYVLRTSLESTLMDAATTVKAYKSLSQVEEAFRCYKSIDLKVRPIYHYKGDRVKAHIFLCMLAYYVEWHLKQCLAPLLFEDEEIDDSSVDVIKANRSESAQSKERKKRNQENFPVHSFRTLLEDLGTICLNTVECTIREGSYRFSKITRPTQLQQKALDLLGVSLICTQ
ncbi:tail length tape measure protein [Microcystis aeruginosa KW]|uniref:Tail length tape measure protein n=1 Tax=Microcystis aeruginosa KW TaxID=1960155 RepID=A0A1V4BXW0_MICAE|nr:tail length tape measure protein [Microcystis aeruginosa KW]OPF19351.1 tail length tape measure protein [Microcystis aeruginosa KW]OPF19813.1 tail length tape measure protein [Microcystis aeruginosa KW]